MENVKYTYQLEFTNGREEEFKIELDNISLTPVQSESSKLPSWTELEFNKCTGCPLSLKYTHCPLAVQLAPLVDTLKDVTSIEKTKVTVTLDERIVYKNTSAQEGISSMMGIITAVSGCPLTEFFKPMARFHLPFANMEETFYRAASMYMLGQYYRWQNNMSADMDMKGLTQYYSNVAKVNHGMAARLRATQREDSAVNALVLLDMFVKSMPDAIEPFLEELKPLFEPYRREQHIF
ncbi:MAG: hypothetical protein OEY65_09995 [Gammaproteobacteria bacterium]|nr:hypothetical protein [Gammaproteobacteria bacterium]